MVVVSTVPAREAVEIVFSDASLILDAISVVISTSVDLNLFFLSTFLAPPTILWLDESSTSSSSLSNDFNSSSSNVSRDFSLKFPPRFCFSSLISSL